MDKRADVIKAAALAPGVARDALLEAAEQLAKVIANLAARIERQITDIPDLVARSKALQSAPGIGAVTAAALIARLPELGRTTARRIAALVGVAPFDDDSGQHRGQHRGQRHIAGGRADIRKALYMAALAATHSNGAMADFYRRLRATGKKPKVAITACMRKLIVRLNAMLANGQDWREKAA